LNPGLERFLAQAPNEATTLDAGFARLGAILNGESE
jgi:hypothetical protein